MVGKDISLEVVVVAKPQIMTPRLGRRWFEESILPPRNKQVMRRLRLSALDAVLALLRAYRDSRMEPAVGHGEGAVVAIMALNADIRKATCSERKVQESEQFELELTAVAIKHVVAVAPQVYQIKSYMLKIQAYLHVYWLSIITAKIQMDTMALDWILTLMITKGAMIVVQPNSQA